jgi:hypothetical protein
MVVFGPVSECVMSETARTMKLGVRSLCGYVCFVEGDVSSTRVVARSGKV